MTAVRIFISHWWSERVSAGSRTSYEQIVRWLNQQRRFQWVDTSVTRAGRVPVRRVVEVEAEVRTRIARSDVVIMSASGAYSGGRRWFWRELRVAREDFRVPKAVLIVKPRGTRYWMKWYTDRADAWATWSARSIVSGVQSLRSLTPRRRCELRRVAKRCAACGNRDPHFELNRLGGVYCGQCGGVLHTLPGRARRWPERPLVWDGFPLRKTVARKRVPEARR